MANTSRPQVSNSTGLDAEITAVPYRGGVTLTITRRRTSRVWVSLDEVSRVIAALQAHVAPVTVRRITPPSEGT
jgi:hypothetical protein